MARNALGNRSVRFPRRSICPPAFHTVRIFNRDLIRASDFHRQKDTEPIGEDMQTIHEALEPESTSNRTVDTHLLRPSIRSIDHSSKEMHPNESLQAQTIQSAHSPVDPSSERSSNTSTESDDENRVPAEEQPQSILLPQTKSARVLSSIDTVHALKLEDTTCDEAVPSVSLALVPTDHSPALSTTQVEASPIYSQPNLPARLYFSPTLLLEEESEAIKQILSPVDQNQIRRSQALPRSIVTLFSIIEKPRVALRRLGQTFVLDRVKTEETHESHDTENIDIYMRPKIIDLADSHVDQP